MHQVVQEINSGKLRVSDIPAPLAQPGEVLIANVASIISAGTERMVIDLAKKSLLGKARERPDLVRRIIEKCRNEGLFNTVRQVRERLDTPMSMGYSSAGAVLACGRGVKNYKLGDRVASNGPHAEIVSVSKHLCARVPDNVDFEQAAFAVLAAIALNGVRLSSVKLGETVFVIGLGLIGQITVALAAASGCRVIGTDLDAGKCELALKMGAECARPGLQRPRDRIADRQPGSRRCADHGFDPVERSDRPRRGGCPEERAGRPHRRRGTGTRSAAVLLQRGRVRRFVLLRSRTIRPRIRRSRPRLSGGLRAAGPKSATCKPCWS